MVKQQQREVQEEPKLALKVKGIVVTDLKEFLAQKRVERAARVSQSENNVNTAESHTQLGIQPMLRAHRPRLQGISRRDEHVGIETSAAKGD